MKTYKWTCTACETPNILVHDDSEEGQVSLSCTKCGTPGKFSPKEQAVRLYNNDVCSTTLFHQVARPPLHWTEW